MESHWFIVIGWIVCAVANYGAGLAYLQKTCPWSAKHSYWAHVEISAVMALAGPVGTIMMFVLGDFEFGFQYGRSKDKE